MVKNLPALSSEVGKVKPLILTPPDPLPLNSRVEFDALVDIVLSDMVIPSMVKLSVVLNVVNVPAAGVDPPITVLLIVPPIMSGPVIMTFPLPLADISRLPHGVWNNHEQQFEDNFARFSPMERLSYNHEVASAMIYLLSDASSYVTGDNLLVEGGWTVW